MKKDSWLYSDSFLKRAFAIWGHYMVANLIIAVPFMILWGVLVALFLSAWPQQEGPGMMQRNIPSMMQQ